MNIYHISISVQELLDDCSVQVSLDFRALRALSDQSPDVVYEDYVLSTDEQEPFIAEFKSAVSELCAKFSSSMRLRVFTEDRFSADISVWGHLPQVVTDRLIYEWMKVRMLIWWYRQRNVDLWQKYTVRLGELASEIGSFGSPACTTRRLRYF